MSRDTPKSANTKSLLLLLQSLILGLGLRAEKQEVLIDRGTVLEIALILSGFLCILIWTLALCSLLCAGSNLPPAVSLSPQII